jgi:hypothetical protein
VHPLPFSKNKGERSLPRYEQRNNQLNNDFFVGKRSILLSVFVLQDSTKVRDQFRQGGAL